MVETKGMHRFKYDLPFGQILMRFRGDQEGQTLAETDITTINTNCLVSDTRKPPPGVQIATHKNVERDAFNSDMYKKYLQVNSTVGGGKVESAIVVIIDNLAMRDRNKQWKLLSSTHQKVFLETCGEDDCEVSKGRLEPLLKLYYGGPMMYTMNSDVRSGEANGSRVLFQELYLKEGLHPFDLEIDGGGVTNAVYASQVHSILVKHENQRMKPECFEVKSMQRTFKAKIKDGKKITKHEMRGTQFPLISNTATTGHKLQGSSLMALLVNRWYYGKNWVYVVLSRVRSMAGLYLLQPLLKQLDKYEVDVNMLGMLKRFRETITLTTITTDEYNDMQTPIPAFNNMDQFATQVHAYMDRQSNVE